MRRLIYTAVLIIASGCTGPEDCAGVGLGGIRLTIVDNATGSSLVDAATVSVKRLTPPPDSAAGSIGAASTTNPLELTRRAEGTYEIVVTAPGYITWQRRVDYRQGCATEPLVLDVEARLEKTG